MDPLETSRPIVIVGAGIIGLNTALAIARRGLGNLVTVVADYFPGDTSQGYVSPAGANFSAISGDDANSLRWDRLGYEHLTKLASLYGKRCWVQCTDSIEYWDDPVSQPKLDSLSKYLEHFRIIPQSELPAGVAVGVSFTTVTINAPKHLEWLFDFLKADYGVQFVHGKLQSISEAYISPDVTLVFNCTGNGAKVLEGVKDRMCYPTRGQTLLAKVPQVSTNMMRHGRDYVTYIIPRPWSNGNAILGGFLQKGVSTSDTFASETQSILKRTLDLSPELRHGSQPEILTALAGLRPSREGGARVEKTSTIASGVHRILVHNYGAGGTGYQAGYGMALDAVQTVDDVLRSLSKSELSRL